MLTQMKRNKTFFLFTYISSKFTAAFELIRVNDRYTCIAPQNKNVKNATENGVEYYIIIYSDL